ncbi:MAG: LasR-specific antiactivator QslA [Pseudomonas sp.]|uniref:LasR-specific antiactivator QslA n=1 Tax=Pseudomonas sp. TaxID=306 RepID=UPI003D13A744
MHRPFDSHLVSHDGHAGASIAWSQDCQQAFSDGVACANTWLDSDGSGWLWANLIVERDALPGGIERRAFEVGFLSRVHQRLCSPLGGNHQARQTLLRL